MIPTFANIFTIRLCDETAEVDFIYEVDGGRTVVSTVTMSRSNATALYELFGHMLGRQAEQPQPH